MIATAREWFAARTPREQLLLQLAVFVVLGFGGAAWAYQSASVFRASAALELASAKELRADTERLRAALASTPAAAPLASDGSPRGIATAGAARYGLQLAQIEPAGPASTRITFSPAPSTNVFSWVDAVERAGLLVTRISLVRAGEGDIVAVDVTFSGRGR